MSDPLLHDFQVYCVGFTLERLRQISALGEWQKSHLNTEALDKSNSHLAGR